ncbi:retrovirus-related pol polyprotein from transposon RE1 [Citrus sinensis]|nr:retrovirus-related pol polyprotein from transposon RE1 [Citrus sinensis]
METKSDTSKVSDEHVKNQISPYYLSTSDNPGNIITQVQLKGDNYDEWARAIRTALRAKKKFGFVDESMKEPAKEPELDDWWTVNSMIVSWILNTIEPTLRSTITHMEVAKKLWDDIKERFSVGNRPRVHQLKSELAESYSLVVQEERVQTITRGKEGRGEPVAFAVQGGVKGQIEIREKSIVICKHCRKTGHDADSCFQLIGYPEWWGDRSRTGGRGAGRGQGGQRQGIAQGGKGRGSQIKANAAHVTSEGSGIQGHVLNADKTGLKGLRSLKLLCDVKTVIACPVGLPDRKEVMAEKKGNIVLDGRLKLTNVLYVPSLNCNLISVSQLVEESNCIIQFTNKFCVIQDRTSRMLIGAGEQRGGLYYFREIESTRALQTVAKGTVDLWHQRLGHPSEKVIKLLPMVDTTKNKAYPKNCDVVLRAKQCRNEFISSNNKASAVLEMIHCDLWGPYRTPTFCGAYYFLTIVDDFSRGLWVYLVNNKSDVGRIIRNFLVMVERQFNAFVKIVRSDNGTEFTCLDGFFATRGIIHQTSCVGTPQQNGRVERKHRHILNIARALRFQANLPLEFWGECILTTSYLINRTPTLILEGKTPYEVLFGKTPSYDNLRVFDCLAYAHNRGNRGDKFDNNVECRAYAGEQPVREENSINGQIEETREEPVDSVAPEARGVAGIEPQLGRGHRQRQLSTRLKDYVIHTTQVLHPSIRPLACSLGHMQSSGSLYLIARYVNCDKFSLRYCAFLAAITAGVEPNSFAKAVKDKKWREAMQQEIHALENNGTWIMEPLPVGKRAIGCKWVFKIKYQADGTVERYKARLVILGNKQVEGIDYKETFAPVAKLVTVRTFLAVAAARKWELHQMDVHNAFLHGDLNEEVYMRMPPGFHSQQRGMVCRLRKSLYGLRQAPRCWFAKLAAALKNYGFSQSYSDYSLFTLHQHERQIHVLVYVDDIIVTRNDHAAIQNFKTYLSDCFHMKDLGVLKYFLGIEVARDGPFLDDPERYRRLPREAHWDAALRVVRYLKGNPGQGILLRTDCDLALYGWCDSDWASCPLTRRSLTGWLVMLGHSPISWKTKKQHTVSRSSAEAEYRSMATTTCELKWLKGLLMSLGVHHTTQMRLYCDSHAALHLVANPVFHERTKHIEVDCHFVRDEIQNDSIRPSYVPTQSQLADIFTKALGGRHFDSFLRKLGIRNLHAPT